MQIDVISGASVAPELDSNSSAPEAGKTHGSFADLLDAVGEDQDEPANEADDKESIGDEWMVVPVLVPFVPAIPQDIVNDECPDATGDDAAVGEVAAVAIELQAPDVVPTPDVKSFVADEAAKPAETESQPESAAATASAKAIDAASVVEAQPIQRGGDDQMRELVEASTEVSATVDSKESLPAEPTPQPPKSAHASTPKAPDAGDVKKAFAADTTVSTTVQNVISERGASNMEPSEKNASDDPAPAAKGVAARFARALERAAEQAISPPAETGENSQSSNQNGDDQPSFGEWLRDQLPQLTASRGHNSASPAFTFVAPAPHDARVSGLLASSGPHMLSNAPSLPNEHDVSLQIVQSMRMQFRDGIGEAVLKLKPDHLGSVSISLKVENGGLKASVQADMPAVRQWLESQQDTLRSALAEHGLRLDQFDVEPDGQRQQADDEGRREQSRKRQAQKREAEQPVFEVVV